MAKLDGLTIRNSYFNYGISFQLVDDFNLTNSTFSNIQMNSDDGFSAFSLISGSSSIKVSGCLFENISSLTGPSVLTLTNISNNKCEINNSTFKNNSSKRMEVR